MSGPLTRTDLEALWHAVTDPLYGRSISEAPEGYEVITQAYEQLGAVAAAANRSSQSLYVLPWSGQTDPPAGGARYARCDVELERVGAFAFAVVLDPTVVRVEEIAVDFSSAGPVEVRTTRRYGLTARVVFAPGEAGPLTVTVRAERAGSGFNWPLGAFTGADGTTYPGALRGFYEPGAGLSNELASVVPSASSHRLRAGPLADVPVPSHVGQQVLLLAGANVGQLRRVVGYLPPEEDDGGSLLLATTAVLAVSSVSGDFLEGEEVTQASGAAGTFLRLAAGRVVVDGTTLLDFGAGTLTGSVSSATATVDAVEQGAQMTAEVGAATWRVVSLDELGLTSSNPLAPSGGDDAVLDMLGDERDVRRLPDEGDDDYRRRVASPVDVVSPLAILRAANRALASYAVEATIREVGTPAFPGMFFDVDDSYDRDCQVITGVASGTFIDGEMIAQGDAGSAIALGRAQVRSPPPSLPLPQPLPAPVLVGVSGVGGTPFVSGAAIHGLTSGASIAAPIVSEGPRAEDRYRVQLGYEDFRAFFLVSAPIGGLGEFGAAYDAGPNNAYDAAPFHCFYDGQPLTSAVGLRALWQAIDEVHAGGVGFDLERP